MLYDFLEEFLKNRKKYMGSIWGFIFGIILIKYGFVKMLVVLVTTIIGYNLGDCEKLKSLKKIIINRLKED